MGNKSRQIDWINSNILTAILPANHFDVWHDRATMHFLTDKGERNHYKNMIFDALKRKGYLIIMVFAEDGPNKCSGLPVRQFSLKDLCNEFENYDLLDGKNSSHFTPDGIEQKFTICLFQLK